MTEEYQAALPEDPDFVGVKINTTDPRYVSAVASAREAGLSQAQFSKMLAGEARRVVDAHKAAKAAAAPKAASPSSAPAASPPPPAPAPKPAPAPTPYKNMSFAERLAAGGHL